MSYHIPLILDSQAVTVTTSAPQLRAGAAVVFTDKNGHVVGPAGRPVSLREHISVRHRYIVDVADKESRIELGLPARGHAFKFPTVLDVSWRVDRPWIVVQRGIQDGYQLLETRLRTLLNEVAHGFAPDQVSEAQEAINARFGSNEGRLPEGIAIHRCFAELSMDPDYLTTIRTHQLDRMREDAVRELLAGDPSGLIAHLVKNPDDTTTVISMISNNRQLDIDTRLKLVDQLRRAGVLQDADLARLGTGAVGELSAFTTAAGNNGAGPVASGPEGPAIDLDEVEVDQDREIDQQS